MHEWLLLLLGLLAWAVIFVPMFLLWWWPERRQRQTLEMRAKCREERLRRRLADHTA